MTHHEHPYHAPEPQARTPWYRTWTGLVGLGGAALAAVYLSLFHVDRFGAHNARGPMRGGVAGA